MFQGGIPALVLSSVREGIRRDIEDAHDQGVAAQINVSVSDFPDHVEQIGGLQEQPGALTLRSMNPLTIWKTFILSIALLLSCQAQQTQDKEQGDNVRVMRREDGSRDVFRRSPDSRTLTKRTESANGVLTMITIYRMDANGNPTGCKIYDGQNNELFKSSYGYRKTDGQLVEERMFDSRVKRIDPATGKEMPVRRFIYSYDAQGKRSAPIAITLTPGKTAEEVYGGPSALEKNPFDEKPAPANPNAKPVGGR